MFGLRCNIQMLGKTVRKVSLSNPFLCAPNASKNKDLRAVSPYATMQSTGKVTNRPRFAHVQQIPELTPDLEVPVSHSHHSIIYLEAPFLDCTKTARISAVAAAIFPYRSPQNCDPFVEAARCAISLRSKMASERRFSSAIIMREN